MPVGHQLVIDKNQVIPWVSAVFRQISLVRPLLTRDAFCHFLAVVVINNPRTQYGTHPVSITCPNCHLSVTTKATRETSLWAWLLCLAIFFFGGVLGCCLIPFCCDACNDTRHTCPNCRSIVGTKRAFS
ncbi:cell death-inducing p53 target 1 [Cichlidogyrus casuarinus]|uniref:Cell death-inducing p53 target 1 n=1 Tax=Cichlidogyrus casuarinus TaxID=1844966 RepID=A0ABD2QDH4_9PLAT